LKVLETDRLILRRLSTGDAEFILELLNEPSFLKFIGDKGVRTLADARDYLLKGPIEMYARLGFGLYLVELKQGSVPIGICGLIKRDFLDDVDIGFAFLPRFWTKGYGYESAWAVLEYGRNVLRLNRIVAITSTINHVSARLLEKLGLKFERMISYPTDAQDAEAVRLFALDRKENQ
jgi:RimJ/RimL family protein N-acetyltransferase